tara:strand:+ start:3690 stop:4619 length:930 start_codon:yes stop_codon:yes gene_type:complete
MNLEPSNQINLFNHDEIFNLFIKLNSQNRFPNKILLSGEKGIGKCTLAYHLINYILSSDEKNSYNSNNFQINRENKSFKLILNKSNPNFDLIDVSEEKKSIDISQIRNLIIKLNKSSFNSKPRFILIDNIEFLNTNSINALLKTLEEPNDKINFILINNNKKISPTLKSRCLNFKISMTFDQSVEVVSKILNQNILNLVNNDLICHYSTPGTLLRLLHLINELKLNEKDVNLREFLYLLIKEKHFKKESPFKDLLFSMIELYFRNNISVNKIKLFNIYSSFLLKTNDMRKFNLDDESLLIEFERKVLNG